MMKTVLSAVLGVTLAGTALADPVAGVWKTAPGDSGGYLHVKIAPCGSAICGTIQSAFEDGGARSTDYEHLGKRLIWDMAADGGGAYSGGKIWAPDNNKTYSSKMKLSGRKLVVKGCVAGGLVCRGQDWKRVK
ncbi:MAG: DUF2147 domain-containing protein [Sedimentitalea sp.]